MNGSSATPNNKEGGISPTELSNMLRKSADIVERKEFHPLLYQTMRALTAYAGEYADGGISSSTTNTSKNSNSNGTTSNQPNKQLNRQTSNNSKDPPSSAFHDVPDSVLDNTKKNNLRSSTTSSSGGAAAAAERVGLAPGSQFSSAQSAAATAGNKATTDATSKHSSSHKGVFSLKGIKKGLTELGKDVHKFVGEIEGKVVRDENAPFDEQQQHPEVDEYAWCDEHFTRGCACKTRGVQQQQNDKKIDTSASTDSLNNNITQPIPSSSAPSTSDAVESTDKPSKPCFQRPINPSSNLIANGWIDQQRRSKMRVVWKDVLASLVEGRRPGEETTLWIQRQVINATTGKVTGLEALHQIPMKWLEDVNYVDLYGDHRFTLKVYNIAEEFYFRTRDESSAQSWVLTLRSARDASLESTNRAMNGGSGGEGVPTGNVEQKKPSATELGLDDLDDWEGGGGPQTGGSDSGGDSSRPSSAPQQQQHTAQTVQQQPRLKVSELRAIAHGAGYNTRGMERQDLERIAAHVRSGGAPIATTQSVDAESDHIKQSMKQEAAMREAEQRAAAEKRERQLKEEARVENMRREREAAEKRRVEEAGEQQRRRQQQEFEAVAEIKRKQEEDRQRKLAAMQEEQRRRAQAAQQQAQNAQQQRPTTIPSPPISGGYTGGYSQQNNNFHHQQQPQHQQQWGQQPQNNYQQQGFNQQYPPQHHHQQFNQQYPPQHNQQWQQQQQQQQQQHHQQQQAWQHHQQQQAPKPPPSNNTSSTPLPSKYAKQMEEKSDEDQSASTLQIKRSILINWALQPPNLNVLRPIDQLITTIHTAMPPAYGVSAHSYFAKFAPITRTELIVSTAMGGHPDETKLKKAVRKVRVFLHPDKLPRDLSNDQAFMARMLWDITSDSWEEFQKHKDELDWIKS